MCKNRRRYGDLFPSVYYRLHYFSDGVNKKHGKLKPASRGTDAASPALQPSFISSLSVYLRMPFTEGEVIM